MTLDSRLNWDEHINRTWAKAKRALNTIKIVMRKKCGANKKTLRKLYSTICRSKIDYGYRATPGRLKNIIACTEKA